MKTATEEEVQAARFVERTRCIACASPDLAELSSGAFDEAPVRDFINADPWGVNPMPHLAGQRWRYVRCNPCGQAFHQRILSPQWNEIRFSEWMTREAIAAFSRLSTSPARTFGKAARNTQHVLRIERLTRGLRAAGEPVRMLDFGCGDGEFLAMCTQYGFDAVGLDRSSARRGQAHLAPVFAELDELSAARLPPFHAISLFEVLEHLDDPAAIVNELSRHLAPGGVLVLETPDCTGVTGIASRDDYLKIHPLDHINGFTPATMRAFATRLGFRPLRRPTAHVTADPIALAKGFARNLRPPSTQQYFVKPA